MLYNTNYKDETAKILKKPDSLALTANCVRAGLIVQALIVSYATQSVFSNMSTEDFVLICELKSCSCRSILVSITVFTFGNNAYGQCGRSVIDGEVYNASRTIHKIERNDVVKVVCGHDNTLILTDTGTVYSCGLGTDGQTGTVMLDSNIYSPTSSSV